MARSDEVDGEATTDLAEVSERLRRWIDREFAPRVADAVVAELRNTPRAVYGGQNPERIHAAHVLHTSGEWDAFVARRDLGRLDWRDLLMAAGLGNADWTQQLDAHLGGNEVTVRSEPIG